MSCNLVGKVAVYSPWYHTGGKGDVKIDEIWVLFSALHLASPLSACFSNKNSQGQNSYFLFFFHTMFSLHFFHHAEMTRQKYMAQDFSIMYFCSALCHNDCCNLIIMTKNRCSNKTSIYSISFGLFISSMKHPFCNYILKQFVLLEYLHTIARNSHPRYALLAERTEKCVWSKNILLSLFRSRVK